MNHYPSLYTDCWISLLESSLLCWRREGESLCNGCTCEAIHPVALGMATEVFYAST